jgi:hypothetical protein
MLFQLLFNGNNSSKADTRNHDRDKTVKYSNIPKVVSPQDIQNVTKQSGISEADKDNARIYAEHSDKILKNQNEELQIRVDFAKKAMAHNNRTRELIAQHDKNSILHEVQNQSVKANLTGYQSAMNKAERIVDL